MSGVERFKRCDACTLGMYSVWTCRCVYLLLQTQQSASEV